MSNTTEEQSSLEKNSTELLGRKHGIAEECDIPTKKAAATTTATPSTNSPPALAITSTNSNKKTEFYDKIIKLKLTEYQIKSNGYPQPHPRELSLAKIYHPPQPVAHGNNRYCRRCKTSFTLDHYNVNRYRSCQYHPKSLAMRRDLYNKYVCCERPKSNPGCQVANYHVYEWLDYDQLKGFIRFEMNSSDQFIPSDDDIFAVDCEMLFTTDGMEAARITVVDINLKSVYDEFIKPIAKIIDYNTAFSGITEATLANVTKRLTDVQMDLKKMFNASTILIGHSLESDLKSLKIVHDKIVDTAILFPHAKGPPLKRALKALSEDYLHRSIQRGGATGHDSTEDAEVCISLVKHYLRCRTRLF